MTVTALARLVVASLALYGGGTMTSLAQSTPQNYDVMIAKLSLVDDDSKVVFDLTPNSLRVRGMTLEKLLCVLFELHPYLINAPAWARTAHWDIDAKISDYDPQQEKVTSDKQRKQRARLLIEQLFALQYHYEEKTSTVYLLSTDKSGLKLKRNLLDPDVPENRGKVGVWSGASGRLNGRAMTFQDLAEELSNWTERPVLDRTGMTAAYDVRLKWASPDNDDPSLPDLPTALKEQAGLSLVESKGTIKIFVVDLAEKPR